MSEGKKVGQAFQAAFNRPIAPQNHWGHWMDTGTRTIVRHSRTFIIMERERKLTEAKRELEQCRRRTARFAR